MAASSIRPPLSSIGCSSESKPSSEFTIQTITTVEQLKVARETISTWKEIIGDRLGQSRLQKDISSENMEAFLEDKKTFEKYREVTSYLSDALTQAQTELKEGKPLQTRIFIALHNSTQKIQGMAASHIETDRVYLKSLISAPWNIPMHAPLPLEERGLVVKGTGKTLLAKSYALAQETGKAQLQTTPLASAFSFYKSVGMSFNQDDCLFTFPVSENVPPSLKYFI